MPAPRPLPFFDGLEQQPAQTTFLCLACAAPVPLDAWDFVSRARSGNAIPEALVCDFGLCRYSVGTQPHTMTLTCAWRGGPAAYVDTRLCPACDHPHTVALALHEFQPARYLAFFIGAR